MERNIQQLAKEAVEHPKISGFLCTDSQGFCLAAEGVANEKSSGIIATIASLAAKLEPASGTTGKAPVICIESDGAKIVIQSKDQITTAIYKNIHASGDSGGGGVSQRGGGGDAIPNGPVASNAAY